MTSRPLTAAAIALCLGIAACGDDENEMADTAPATTETAVPTTPAAVETGTSAEAGAGEETINRAAAQSEAARQASLAAEDVPDSDLFFASKDDVECSAPGATQPDNANEQASEWSCTLDAETNGVRCEGTVVVFASRGANPGKTFEGIDVRDAGISCSPA